MKMTKRSFRKKAGNGWAFLARWQACFLLVAVVVGLISMLIPQLINSISGVMETLPASINNLEIWLKRFWQTIRIWSNRSCSITAQQQIICRTG